MTDRPVYWIKPQADRKEVGPFQTIEDAAKWNHDNRQDAPFKVERRDN